MIGYLEGEVVRLLRDGVLLLTTGGVGYQVHLPLPYLGVEGLAGSRRQYFVVTVVREGELSLYGFHEPAGKALFESLIGVSGIGPKAAIAMLSAFSPAEVTEAILTENVARLATVPGIGRKTAARLCVELSDRLGRDGPVPGQQADGRAELVSALTNLGFPEKDVLSILPKVPADLPSLAHQLRQALTLLGRA